MDEKETTLKHRLAEIRGTDTGNLDLEECYDTGANHLLWGKRSKAVKAMSKVVANLRARCIGDTGDEQ